ncbi:hypothetical protein [Paraburkholderia tagetis]|uniref:Uncharacterized protein n=1 Tax=Paraburkholderia tagetis TaxID=2913261 RepID=A0A9X1UNR9_9BURK|nr:hypothetical protein [Paraburkholderia tagetis]MCG5078836.1 hypothetical protein [Paraburkholderia tagetis]
MNTFGQLRTLHASPSSAPESKGISREVDASPVSLYAILLRSPLMRIAGHVSNRPDISKSAILGYN